MRQYWRMPSSAARNATWPICATSWCRAGRDAARGRRAVGRLPVGRHRLERGGCAGQRGRSRRRAHLHHRLRAGRLRRDAPRPTVADAVKSRHTCSVLTEQGFRSRSPTPSRPSTSPPSTASTRTSSAAPRAKPA
jgi:hypothetical protein